METLVQQFIKAFGWSIINSLWQSAIIYGVLFVIMLSLPKLAAKYKHNLAFGSIVLMFIGFLYNFIKQMSWSIPKEALPINAENQQLYQYFNNLPPSFSSKAEQYFPIVVTFYIIGILLQLFVISKGYNQLSKFKKESLSSVPDSWKMIFDQVTTTLKIQKAIKFNLSAIVNVPVVIGYLKPVVLFPLALVNQLDNDQVEAILIHELSHIRRNDFLLNLIKTAIETLLFYNPFVWMAGRFIHIEREHACDDLVLKVTGKPLNYAHALLKLELLKDKNSPAYALAATGKSQNLYQRIKRITNMKTNYLNAKQQMAALTLGVACLFSIAWINPAEKKKETKKIVKQQVLSIINTQANDVKTIVCIDTTKKRKIKIVTVDANGIKTEYNSVKEMPDSLKKAFYEDNATFGKGIFINIDSNHFKYKMDTAAFSAMRKKFESKEWKDQMIKIKLNSEEMAKKMNSPEFKKQMEQLRINSEAMAKKFNSIEWKKQQEELRKQFSSPEFKARMDSTFIVFRSPEFRAHMDSAMVIVKSPEFNNQIKELSRNIEVNVRKQITSAKLAELSELRNSAEYKKLREKFEKDVKELREKKEKAEKKEKPEAPEKPEKQEN